MPSPTTSSGRRRRMPKLTDAVDRCARRARGARAPARGQDHDLDADVAAGRDRVLRGIAPRRRLVDDPPPLRARRDRALPDAERLALRADARRVLRTLRGGARPSPLETLVLTRIGDALSLPKRIGFWATRGRKNCGGARRCERRLVERHHESVRTRLPAPRTDPDDLATILYSGGTTGLPKGIMLSHHNVTSEAMQVAAWVAIDERDVVLAVLPIFHGSRRARPRRPAQRGEARDGAGVQRQRSLPS